MENIQLTLFGKTFPEHSVQTREKISGEFSKKSQKPKFQYLNVENGQKAEWSNYQTVQSLGELSTLSIGVSPSIAVESTLSQILEVNAPQKYYLSTKACQGILRRAEKRGKELPPLLKAVLESQAQGKFLIANSTNFESAGFISRAPAEAYSIGYEEEMSATLRSGLVPDVLQGIPKSYGICSQSSNSMKSSNPHSGIYETEISKTLDCNGGNPTCNQGGVVIVEPNDMCSSIGFCLNNSSTAAGLSEINEKSPTLSTTKRVGVCYCNSFIWIARRLTPRECERLQGFIDDWTMYDTDGNEFKDTPRYKALGNSIAIPCALRVFRGIVDIENNERKK